MDSEIVKQQKAQVGREAVNYIHDGMVIGIGSGSTMWYLVEELGKRVKAGLNIIGVPTSNFTKKHAEKLGIPIKDIDDVDHIDLTIDGADQIDANYQGIKGGGASHLMEKIVATNSTKNMWIVDETKMVPTLNYPVPLEVIPYGSKQLEKKLKKMGLNPRLRYKDNGEFVRTDSNNYIIDLYLPHINNPTKLAEQLDTMVGIVEHGLFLDIVNTIIVQHPDGPQIIEAR
ncbi:ribose 5-phosphate isomerase A [Fructilactobacillus lindneri]|nr:ribose-5-phosphate isomerase RpiA [Fructilactobacillus lindneri]ANZ57308.1 ribose-5-phosphate isomerase [Fructilactobacillus lindneri]ANZ58573.1 ribose-5-phosphate isomerase [Fructilactobacillus lindneri]POG98386.1 ribose 5-phosphate isomerase A [Fructilactobacillus lindneri]POH03785.1 ribose 5-phosphate isomerase A [Fructilactobacillus lindneri]POH04971.1 ribose 5-phosphate isomerase A [Fructilactobacillus lindneri]